MASALGDQVGALVADDDVAVLVEGLGLPGDDAEGGARAGLASADDAARGGDRVARVDRPVELHLVDAEERTAALGEVLDRHADHGAEHEQRVDDDRVVPVGARVLGVEVERREPHRRRGEQRVVRLGEGAAPVVLEGPAFLEVLVAVALLLEGEGGEVGVGHAAKFLPRGAESGSSAGCLCWVRGSSDPLPPQAALKQPAEGRPFSGRLQYRRRLRRRQFLRASPLRGSARSGSEDPRTQRKRPAHLVGRRTQRSYPPEASRRAPRPHSPSA